MKKPIQVVTTTDSLESAKSLVRALVDEQLVACGQIDGPVFSIYRWKEKVEASEEFRCILKSDQRLWEQLGKRIRELHSYDVPEILVTEVAGGSKDYLAWLDEQLVNVKPDGDNS